MNARETPLEGCVSAKLFNYCKFLHSPLLHALLWASPPPYPAAAVAQTSATTDTDTVGQWYERWFDTFSVVAFDGIFGLADSLCLHLGFLFILLRFALPIPHPTPFSAIPLSFEFLFLPAAHRFH